MKFKNKDKFLRKHTVISLLLVCRWILSVPLGALMLSRFPIVSEISRFLLGCTLLLIDAFVMMEINYWYWTPYIIYYLYLIIRMLYNFDSIAKDDAKYIISISISIMFILIISIVITPIMQGEWAM